MPLYKYKASSRDGKLAEGVLEAATREEAVRKIQASSQIPLRIVEKGFGKDLSLRAEIKLPGLGNRVSQKDLLIFTQEFETLVQAGLPLDRCLSILSEVTANQRLAKVIQDVLIKVEGGSSLAEAMQTHPKVFSKLYVNMVRSGEAGGVLDSILQRLGEYQGRIQELKEHLASALIYPALLLLVGTASMIILMAFVIPKFQEIFESMGQALPLSTTILMSTSGFIRHYWWVLVLAMAAGSAFFRSYVRTEAGRLAWDKAKLKLPLAGGLVQKIETSRFARTLGTLLHSGVPFLQALDIVRDVLQNRVISSAIQGVTSDVRGGKGIAGPLAKARVFPPLALHLIRVGEETGTLDRMLLQVAENYDRYFQNAVKRLIALMEPVMILVMALVIGFVVVSMLAAIFSINQMPM